MRAFFIFLNDDEGIFKGQYPHDFSRGFAASLSLCKWTWDSMLVYLSGDLCSIILCHFGFLGIWLGSSQSNGVAEANWLIPYLRSPCTFSALIFYCILGSLLQRWINSSYVSRRNITCFCGMQWNCSGEQGTGISYPLNFMALRAWCSSRIPFLSHQCRMWLENASMNYTTSETVRTHANSNLSFIKFYRKYPKIPSSETQLKFNILPLFLRQKLIQQT